MTTLMRVRFLVFVATLTGTSGMGTLAYGAELTASIAVVDITPPLGYRMSGYFRERISTGVYDPLRAKALVLSQGDTKAALVFCDLLGLWPAVTNPARQRASERTNIPVSHIVIHATHTHTGPLYFGAIREHFHKIAVRQHGTDPRERIDYSKFLEDKLVEVIIQAATGVKPVSLRVGVAQQDPVLSFNRRFHMKDGPVRFNPGQQNANIVRPCGPIDPDVGMIMLTAAGTDNVWASLTVFANHLDTTGGTEYSADYPGHLENALRKTLGDNLTSLFGTGTCGDINHVDVTTKGRRSPREIGDLLAKTVLSAKSKLRPIPSPCLAVRSKKVIVPMQKYDAKQIKRASEKMKALGSGHSSFRDLVEACKIMDLQLRPGPTIPLEVQVFRLSKDVAIVTLPGEVFVELGLAIKQASPFKTTMVIELCNDDPVYIPTEKAFAEGSYEVTNSRIQSGGGEKMVEAAIRMLKELAG